MIHHSSLGKRLSSIKWDIGVRYRYRPRDYGIEIDNITNLAIYIDHWFYIVSNTTKFIVIFVIHINISVVEALS